MVFDSYDSGNSGYFYRSIRNYTTKELCEELKKRVETHGTGILDDFIDWVEFYRNAEILAEASKIEEVIS